MPRRASASARLLDAGIFDEILPPAERVIEPASGAARRAGGLRRRRRRSAAARSTASRCSSRRRKAASWAAPSARCTAPSWSACSSARCASGRAAVLLLAESGGVRLHEANAGLIAVSEVMRALLDVRAAGIPVVVADRRAERLLRRHGHRRALLRRGRHERGRPARAVGPGGDRDRRTASRSSTRATARWSGAPPAASTATCCGDCDGWSTTTSRRSAPRRCRALGRGPRPLTLEALEARARAARAAHRSAAATARRRRHLARAGHRRARSACPISTPTLRALRAARARSRLMDWQDSARHAVPRRPRHAARRRSAARHRRRAGEPTIAVIGTTDHARDRRRARARAGARRARHGARASGPRRSCCWSIPQGQRLRHRDELLGINRYMAHLGDASSWRAGAGIACSGWCTTRRCRGGFITPRLMADACYALPEAEIRVMRLPAMARVTKLDEQSWPSCRRATRCSRRACDNYVAMGAVRSLWRGDLRAELAAALDGEPGRDRRAEDGAARGGRRQAAVGDRARRRMADEAAPYAPRRHRNQLVWIDDPRLGRAARCRLGCRSALAARALERAALAARRRARSRRCGADNSASGCRRRCAGRAAASR